MLFYVESLVIYFFANSIFLFGLNIQFGLAGIVNLAFIVFFSLGAYLDAIFSIGSSHGPLAQQLAQTYFFGATLPWPIPILLAIVGTVVFSFFVGKLILRTLRPDFAALASVAVMQICYNLVNNIPGIFNGAAGLQGIPAPLEAGLHASSKTYSYVFMAICMVWCAGAFLFTQRITKSPLGRAFRSTRENPLAAEALGKDVAKLRLLAFIIGGGLAGLAGALFVEYITVWAPAAWSFPETVLLFAALYIGGRGNNWGAMLGSLVVYVGLSEGIKLLPPIGSSAVISASMSWIFLGFLLIAFIWFRPQGLIPERRPKWKQVAAWSTVPARIETSSVIINGITVDDSVATAIHLHSPHLPVLSSETILLRTEGLTKMFGGVCAVDNCSINVHRGIVTGLIGPNGAGKSTLMDMIAGTTKPNSGTVWFQGENITNLVAHDVARKGISRTFQKSSEFPRLSVLENMMAAPQNQPGEHLATLFLRPRAWRKVESEQLDLARDLLDRFGLLRMANEYASNLSGGQLRLLEMARALMTKPTMLMLDEPMAGVNPALTEEILRHLRDLVDDGLTIVLVEHELEVIDRVCDTVLVMAEGTLLSEGTMAELRADKRVVEAYLA